MSAAMAQLTFISLWAYSADDKFIIFFIFFQENKMKCQILSSGKYEKNISICHLLEIVTGVLSIKQVLW